MTLLGLYQQSNVLISKLTLEEQNDIITLATDKRFKSLAKLLNNEKASFLSQSLFSGRTPDEVAIIKGASVAITAILASIDNTIISDYQNRMDVKAQKGALDFLDW
jgi:high-affinity K+ transport system ATPase subunit B